MSMRLLAVAAVGLLCAFGLALAEEPSLFINDPVPNWTAPPYWTPPDFAVLERLHKERTLSPEALEVLPSGPLPFIAIAPCRLLDTRNNLNPLGGGGPFAADETRTYTLPGACALPSGMGAASLNVTATNTGAGAFGHIKVWPADGAEPNVSTLNYPGAGATLANAAVVPLSNTGALKVKSGNAGADVILDVNGYYAPISIVNTVNGLSGAVTLAQGTNVSITPSGNTLTITNTAPAAWQLAGNSGTAPASNFVGTTDDQPFIIKVNNQRAMRFEPHTATMVPNVIGGSGNNSVTAGVYSATIGGGGFAPNVVTDSGGTVAGGSGNRAGDNAGITTDQLAATVGGGSGNVANGAYSVVGGGQSNTAGPGGSWMTVAGGYTNLAQTDGATVGGGLNNTANNAFATVPGGRFNAATAQYAFAAGRRAKAVNQGAFVWGDSTDADVSSTADNQFIVRARGGFTFYPDASTTCTLTSVSGWNCSGISDRNAKREFAAVDTRETLARLLDVPIQSWSYKGEIAPVRHMGPMAQDFAAAYGLGADDKSINSLDANGVALAAIQGLYEMVKERDAEIDALKVRLSKLEQKMD